MKKTGAINGIVLDENNRPVADCSILIVSGPAHIDLLPLTDRLGRFSLQNLLPGKYIIKVYSSTANTNNIIVNVKQNKAALVEVWFNTQPVPMPKRSSNKHADEIVDEENSF